MENRNITEEIKRNLLLMKYDLKRTNEENSKLIFENPQSGQLVDDTTDPAYIEGVCNRLQSAPSEFSRYKGASMNADLGIEKALSPKGWKVVAASDLDEAVSGDNGLVDALDVAPFSDTIEEDIAIKLINGYRQSMVWNEEDSKYYPAIEYMRARYEEDESGDTLMGDLDDPEGFNTQEKMDACKKIKTAVVLAYEAWIKAVRLVNNCDGTKKPDDGGQQGGGQQGGGQQGGGQGVTPPDIGANNCVEKLTVEDKGTMTTSDGAIVNWYDVPFDTGAGYNKIYCRKATCVTGSFIAYNSSDKELGRGSWACRGGSFKITEYKKTA